jgi:hypothetical protein
MMLCAAAAGGAAWLSVSLEASARQLVAGVTGQWALAVITASLVVLLLSTVTYLLAINMARSGLIRGLALAWSLVGLLWIPTALAAGALRAGSGPMADLYNRLGDPQAGRWASLALAIVILIIISGPASRRAIETGRSWMRVDGLEFRRRLVRVVAGWPGAIVMVVLGIGAGWANTPWLALWMVAVLASLQLRTR